MDHELAQLNAVDIRHVLPRRNWEIGRRTQTTSITVHYSGPEVPMSNQSGQGLINQLTIDANWQMTKGWGGSTDGADGLMYHVVVASDGTVYQSRDLDAMLWHCATSDGNQNGLAVHLPLGGNQSPTDVQWQALIRVLNTLRQAYSIPINRILGHLEWKHATLCPGPVVMPRLAAWRNAPGAPTPTPVVPPITRYQVITTDGDPLNIRQGPGVQFPIAGTLKRGAIIYVDVAQNGWAHMAKIPNEQSDLGFCSLQYLSKVG